MRRAAPVLGLVLLVAACHRDVATPAAPATAASALEAAAIQAGVIPDPDGTDPSGLYARETDRVCIVPTATAYRVGVVVDYGDDQRCGGSGTATRVGETLHIELGDAGGCSFDARFEGDRIVFPGRVPDACRQICERRASVAALDVARLSESVSEASTLRDTNGRLLCASGG